MATYSGTQSWLPTAGDLAFLAFGRIGLKRSEVLGEHLADASTTANMVQIGWANQGSILSASELVQVAILQGVATYTLAEKTIDIETAYLTVTSGSSTSDVTLSAISTTDYAGIPQKTNIGQPSCYWYNRQIVPTLTLWPVPTTTYTLNLRQLSRLQDVVLQNGANLNIPYRWIDAFTWGWAAQLAPIYAPDRFALVDAKAKEVYAIAATEDNEDVPVRIAPVLEFYSR